MKRHAALALACGVALASAVALYVVMFDGLWRVVDWETRMLPPWLH